MMFLVLVLVLCLDVEGEVEEVEEEEEDVALILDLCPRFTLKCMQYRHAAQVMYCFWGMHLEPESSL